LLRRFIALKDIEAASANLQAPLDAATLKPGPGFSGRALCTLARTPELLAALEVPRKAAWL